MAYKIVLIAIGLTAVLLCRRAPKKKKEKGRGVSRLTR